MTDIVPQIRDAKWFERSDLKALVAALDPDGGLTRYVGGAVRDTLRGADVNDIDMATILKPEIVMERLRSHDIKVVPTGIEHGTVTAVLPDGPVEITTLRRDVSTDGRRATVAFSDDWKEDAARRDFTINALYLDPYTREIYDYFNGQNDLKANMVRFIGSAEQRIKEDYLRIMRFFRFTARFGIGDPDAEVLEACTAHAAGLKSLSRERIADELLKLLGTDDPRMAVIQMQKAGIFSNIISEIDEDVAMKLEHLIVREKTHNISPSAIRRLIALLPKDAEKSGKIAKKLRLSKKRQRAVVDRLTADVPTADNIRALAYSLGTEAARDIALLFASDTKVAASLEKLEGWQKPDFPLTGGDLIKMGLEPGPIVSETLAKVEQAWMDEGFPDTARVKELAEAAI